MPEDLSIDHTTGHPEALLVTEELIVSIAGKELCKPLTLSMHGGESWAVLGANGSGKTTLLLTLAGLLPVASGKISLDGKLISQTNLRLQAKTRSILFQKPEDAFPSTVLETVLAGRHPHIPYWQTESKQDFTLARRALSALDLSGFEQRDINTLSGGERQRVAIATALTQDTAVRLFDEPSNHLDLKHQNTVLNLLTKKDNKLNILVLQDINQAWKHCSHALLLHSDGTVETGTINDMLTIEKLAALYSCSLRMIKEGNDCAFIHT